MTLSRSLVLVGALVLAAIPATAHAERGGKMRERIQERIRTMRITRIIEALDLDEKGATRVVPIVNKAYDAIGAVAKDAGAARRELRGIMNGDKADDAKINNLIDRLVAAKGKIDRIEDELIRDLRRVLAPQQAARLVVLLPEINRQLQRQVREAAGWGRRRDRDGQGPRERERERDRDRPGQRPSSRPSDLPPERPGQPVDMDDDLDR